MFRWKYYLFVLYCCINICILIQLVIIWLRDVCADRFHVIYLLFYFLIVSVYSWVCLVLHCVSCFPPFFPPSCDLWQRNQIRKEKWDNEIIIGWFGCVAHLVCQSRQKIQSFLSQKLAYIVSSSRSSRGLWSSRLTLLEKEPRNDVLPSCRPS